MEMVYEMEKKEKIYFADTPSYLELCTLREHAYSNI